MSETKKPRRIRVPSILGETWSQMKEAQLLMVASSLAYTTILSIIPVLAVSFAIFKAFGGLDKLYSTVEPFIFENLAEGTDEQALSTLRNFVHNANAGAVGAGGLVGLILTTMSMLNSIENAINRVWHTVSKRSLFQRVSSYWLFVTLGPLAMAVGLGFFTSTDMPVTKILPGNTGLLLLTTLVLAAVYKYVPSCTVRIRYALGSAAMTAIVFNLARVAYSFYVRHAMSYDKIYGSLGAVPILLLWIYIMWVVVLSGASLTAALQKRFEARTTKEQAG